MSSFIPGSVWWIDVSSTDPAGSRDFYAGLFGWTYQIAPGRQHYTTALLAGRPVAGLAGVSVPAGHSAAWRLYLASANIERTAQVVTQWGGRVLEGPVDAPGPGRAIIGMDPTGAVIGFWQPGSPGTLHTTSPGSLSWAELNTWDGPRADAFFAQVFDYHQEQIGDGTSVDYSTWSSGGPMMLGRLQMNEDWADPDTGAHWMLHFAVDPQTGTDAAVDRVLELGGRVDFDPYDSELGRLARVADPSGATFALIDPTKRLEPTPITIYLSDESVHEQVEAAVEGVFAAAGGHIEHRDDPVFGSWLRRMRARTGQAVLSPLAREAAVVAAHGAESRLVHAQDATNTATMLQNLGPVLAALQSTKEAVIRAGALLIVKIDSTLVVHQLTSAQQLQLDHQPQLAQSPHDILSALELRPSSSTQSADGVDGTCGSTTAPWSINCNPAPLRITSNNSEGSTPLNAANHQAFPETGAGA